MQSYQNRVENTILTPSFDAVYARALTSLGEEMSEPLPGASIGSSDVGNVSQVVPTIQPTISITDVPTPWHTEASKAAARSEKGLASIALGAKALALTAVELLCDPDLLAAIKRDHRQALERQRQGI